MENLSEIIKKITLNYSLHILEDIANDIEKIDINNFNREKNKLIKSIYDPELKRDIELLINKINDVESNLTTSGISLALKSSISLKRYEQSYQNIETIWTGPESNIIPLRRTDMALTQLINSSHKELLIVTYTVYEIESLLRNIEKALERNVNVLIILEHKGRNKEGIEKLKDRFGAYIKQKAQFYIWPNEIRDFKDNDKGCLHVKCATSDENMLFLSSANLTRQAMNLNMELGLLITGGQQPKNILNHFKKLISENILVKT